MGIHLVSILILNLAIYLINLFKELFTISNTLYEKKTINP
jgi:hypothetical protein